MTDCDSLAEIHADCFTTDPAPWSAALIRDSLLQKGSFLLQDSAAFLIGRIILDEAELLTLAVSPAFRRQGIARNLVTGFLDTAGKAGASKAFLEVAEDNISAIRLYQSTGWQTTGKRPRYYGAVAALIMTYTFRCKNG